MLKEKSFSHVQYKDQRNILELLELLELPERHARRHTAAAQFTEEPVVLTAKTETLKMPIPSPNRLSFHVRLCQAHVSISSHPLCACPPEISLLSYAPVEHSPCHSTCKLDCLDFTLLHLSEGSFPLPKSSMATSSCGNTCGNSSMPLTRPSWRLEADCANISKCRTQPSTIPC